MSSGEEFDRTWFRLKDSLDVDKEISKRILDDLIDFLLCNGARGAAANIREIRSAFEEGCNVCSEVAE